MEQSAQVVKGLKFIQNQNDVHLSLESLKPLIIPILKKYGIKKAGVFGSAARGAATIQSDIDILVELPARIGLLEFMRIRFALEDVLKMKVDLAEYRALKPQLREGILADEHRLYG
jgi:predicted nucleotidyltransferase